MPAGRPPFYKTPEEFEAKVDEYFAKGHEYRTVTDRNGDERKISVYTITGLALYLGFCDRYSFYDYEKKPEFTHTVKRARTFIERHYEGLAQGTSPTGAIFALKNFGWKDRQEIDQTVSVTQMPTIKLKNGEELHFDIGDDPDDVE